MTRFFLLLIGILFLAAAPASAQTTVSVIGPIIPGDCAVFNSTTVIKDSGTTGCVGSGGSASPGGPSGSVQFNNAGAFGGLSNAQLTALINPFSAILSGVVNASGGVPGTFLHQDNTWSALIASDIAAVNLAALPSDSTTWRTAIVNDTILNTDCRKTIQLGTGSTGQISETFPGVGGFPTGCEFTVFNADTAIGKQLIGFPSGCVLTSAILYPLQAVTLQIVNGVLTCRVQQPRYRQPGVNYYVANTGNDANDCLAVTRPCLRIGTAVLRLYQELDNQNASPQINIACGTYNESVSIEGPVGYSSVFFIVGASSSSHCVDWRNATGAGAASLTFGDLAVLEIQNLYFECSGCSGTNFGIFQHQHSIMDILLGVEFGDFGIGTDFTCDSMGKTNWPQALAVTGPAGFIFDLGPSCVAEWANPASGININNTPTFVGLVRENGNASVLMSGLNWRTGTTGITAGQQWAATGSSYIDQSGVIWPVASSAGAPVPTTSPYGGVAK